MEPKDPTVAEVLEGHATIRQLMADLEAFMSQKPEVPPTWMKATADKLQALNDLLVEHFHIESGMPVFAETALVAPRYAAKLERLEGQHSEFLAEMKALMSTANEGATKADHAGVQALSTRIRALFVAIGQHESEENEIFMSAHWDDLGAQD